MSHLTTDNPALGDENNGRFFIRPPIDHDEIPEGVLDVAVKPILYVEVCNTEGLVGFDEFTDVCPAGRLVGRLDDTNPLAGQTLSIQSAGSFDYYEAVLKLGELAPNLQELHTIRVMIGSPETPGAFFVPGYVPAIFTDNASEANDPPFFRVGDLPWKFFLSDLATRQLVCGDTELACTFDVWDLGAEEQTLCHPVNDCDGSEATVGLRGNQATLGEIASLIGASQVLVTCQEIPDSEPPLEGPLNVSPEFVDCSFLPDFVLSQNLLDFQACNAGGDAFVGGHLTTAGLVEFLLAQFNSAIFPQANCEGFGQLAANAGFFDKMRFAAMNRVFRPLAGLLGPQPLSAGDGTSWGTRDGRTPYFFIEPVNLLFNEGPEAIEPAGSTVTASVCVALAHLVPTAPAGEGIPITFEVTQGTGTIGGAQSTTVTTTLQPKGAGECTVTDAAGQIAAASVQWTLSGDAEANELEAFVPGDYVQLGSGQEGVTAEPVDISFTFSTQTVELLGACTVPDEFAAYDQFAQRGFYILPDEFGIQGDVLNQVQLRISSNDKSSGGLAGEYRVSLSARRGGYHPSNQVGMSEATFSLSGNPPENQVVTFTFSGLPTLTSEPLTFVAEILDAPRNNAKLWFRVPEKDAINGFPRPGDLACTGAIVTNGTTFTTPLDTDRRQGMDITLLGVDNP